MKKYIVLVVACLIALVSCDNDKKATKTDDAKIVIDSLETIESISQKIRENPHNADLFLKRSELRMHEHNIDEAIADAELALKLDSLRPEIYIRISDYSLAKNQSEKAEKILVNAIQKFPTNTDVRLRLAYVYFYVGMYDSAMEQIAFLEENKLYDAETYFLKALIFDEIDNQAAAIDALKMAIEYNNNFFEAHNLLGIIYSRLGDEMAVEHFKTATRLFPDNIEIRYHAGYVFQQFKHYDRAIAEYEYIISKNPEYFLAYFNLGNIYVNANEYQKAEECFSRAIDIDPLSHESYYNRGYVYELQKNYKLAEADYKKALEIHPNYELAVEGINEVLGKMN